MLKGNHEIYYTDIVKSGTANVHEAELTHQKWVAEDLGDSYLEIVDGLEIERQFDIEGVKMLFCHYPYNTENNTFEWFIDFDENIDRSKFNDKDADLYVFGHQHTGSDVVDDDGIRYLNLNSAGATKGSETTYAIIEIQNRAYKVTIKYVSYDRLKVIDKIDKLEVPERAFIKQIFFGVEQGVE